MESQLNIDICLVSSSSSSNFFQIVSIDFLSFRIFIIFLSPSSRSVDFSFVSAMKPANDQQYEKHVHFDTIARRRTSEDLSRLRRFFGGRKTSSTPQNQPTFPVSVLKHSRPSIDVDSVRDFLFKNNTSTTIETPMDILQQHQEIRKLSLKSFTGLEELTMGIDPLQRGTSSSELRERSMSANAASGSANFLSPRRLISIPESPQSWTIVPHRPNLLSEFSHRRSLLDTSPVETSESAQLSSECDIVDCLQVRRIVSQLSGLLQQTVNRLPGKSLDRNKSADPDEQILVRIECKRRLLYESQQYVSSCTQLVHSPDESLDHHLSISANRARKLHRAVECLLSLDDGRANLFQAQLLVAKVAEALSAFDRVVECRLNAKGEQFANNTDEKKRLIGCSTTLTATLNQLVQAVKDVRE